MRIFVRMPNWLGDAVMALAFLEALRRHYSESEIHILIHESLAPVAEGYGTIHTFKTRFQSHWVSLKLRFSLGKAKRCEEDPRSTTSMTLFPFELGFSFPSSYTSNLNLWLAGVKLRLGFQREGGFFLHRVLSPPNRNSEHMILSYLRLLKSLDERVHLTLEEPRLMKMGLHSPPDPPSPLSSWDIVCLLVPFTTYGEAKELPLLRYLEIAEELRLQGLVPLFIGTERERLRFPKNTGEFCAFGTYTLSQWIRILPHVRAVIGNDSGFMHLSAALGVPTLTFFLSTSPTWTAPQGAKVRVLYDPVPCSPCFAKKCPLKHEACKALWNRQRTLAALREFINSL